MHIYGRRNALPKKTLKSVKNSGNEIIVQVKNNQKKLLESCEDATKKRKNPSDKYISKNKIRNRKETREIQTFIGLKHLPKNINKEWGKYFKMIIKVNRSRKEFNTEKKQWIKSNEISYYISTVKLTAKESAKAIRRHWGIENRNHYVRDVAMNEDKSRIRVNADRFVRLRSFALNILRVNKVENVSQELYKNCLNINRIFSYDKGI